MKIKITAIIGMFLLSHFAAAQEKTTIRFGHFPNITHAQGVIAHALSRQGKGWFEQRLGPKVEIQWFTYNAGPSAMEAVFAGSLDLTYVGQGPALNAHFKSNGEEVRVIAGAANAGAALVVKTDSPIKTAADFLPAKIRCGLVRRVCFHDQCGARIGRSGNDADFFPVGFEVRVERRSLTDVGQIERAGKHRFHRRWTGVVGKPLDLHLWSESLLEPAFSLARKGVGDHPLGVSDIREMAEAYDNLFLGRNKLCKNTDRSSYEQD